MYHESSILKQPPYNGINPDAAPSHKTTWDERFQDWCIFISTRNPYTRAVSQWKYTRKNIISYLSEPYVQFRPFIEHVTRGFDNKPPTFFEFLTKFPLPKHLLTTARPSWHLEQIPRQVDYVIHQERLSTDLLKIPALSGIVEAIVPHNVSTYYTPWHAYYTPDSIAWVNEYWGQDFAAFGYNPDFEACVRGEFFTDPSSS